MTGRALPQEREVQFWVDGTQLHTFYCTLRDLPELAVGALSARGMLDPDRLPTVWVSEGDPWALQVRTRGGVPRRKVSSDDPDDPFAPSLWHAGLQEVVRLARAAMEYTPLRQQSGGVHAAAIGWEDGLLVREDVARHNAVDKAIGAAIMKGVDLSSALLFTTGRLSHEMVAKAAAAGIPVAATMKYPTDLGLSLAIRQGICLVGEVLSPQPVVYTGKINESIH